MNEQGIVALISGNANDVPQSSKCPFSHGEAMQKMDDYLAYDRYQPEATPENVSQLVKFSEFSANKRESTIKQTSILFYFSKSSDIN